MTMASLWTGRSGRPWDVSSLAATPAAVVVVLGAYLIGGGPAGALLDGTAALAVIVGTLAAVLVSHTPGDILAALRAAGRAFVDASDDARVLAADLVAYAIGAHRRGPLVLEHELEKITDPFLRNGLALAIDGERPEVLRETLAAEKRGRDVQDELPIRVFESAAGYAPVLGLLGGVLVLIPALDRGGAIGPSVAAALVAVLYGVGAASLVLLPVAARLRRRAADAAHRRDLAIEAIVAIGRRTHPRVLAQTLRAFVPETPPLEQIAARVRVRTAPPAARGGIDAPSARFTDIAPGEGPQPVELAS